MLCFKVVFGPSEDFQVSPGETPVEQLEEGPAGMAAQGTLLAWVASKVIEL